MSYSNYRYLRSIANIEERHFLDLPASKTHPLEIKDIKGKQAMWAFLKQGMMLSCALCSGRGHYCAKGAEFLTGIGLLAKRKKKKKKIPQKIKSPQTFLEVPRELPFSQKKLINIKSTRPKLAENNNNFGNSSSPYLKWRL